MGTRITQVLEHLARACPRDKIHNPYGVAPELGLDIEDVAKDVSGHHSSSRFDVGRNFLHDIVNNIHGIAVGIMLPPLGKCRDLPNGLDEELQGGYFSNFLSAAFVDSAMIEVRCP